MSLGNQRNEPPIYFFEKIEKLSIGSLKTSTTMSNSNLIAVDSFKAEHPEEKLKKLLEEYLKEHARLTKVQLDVAKDGVMLEAKLNLYLYAGFLYDSDEDSAEKEINESFKKLCPKDRIETLLAHNRVVGKEYERLIRHLYFKIGLIRMYLAAFYPQEMDGGIYATFASGNYRL